MKLVDEVVDGVVDEVVDGVVVLKNLLEFRAQNL